MSFKHHLTSCWGQNPWFFHYCSLSMICHIESLSNHFSTQILQHLPSYFQVRAKESLVLGPWYSTHNLNPTSTFISLTTFPITVPLLTCFGQTGLPAVHWALPTRPTSSLRIFCFLFLEHAHPNLPPSSRYLRGLFPHFLHDHTNEASHWGLPRPTLFKMDSPTPGLNAPNPFLLDFSLKHFITL